MSPARHGVESLDDAQIYNDDVIRPLDNAIYKEGALAVLRGNLAPQGCVVKAFRRCAEIPETFRPGAGIRQLCRSESQYRSATIWM